MDFDLARVLTYFAAMLFSLTFHEAAHALAAKVQGDDTAERLGRLSLSPLPHIDWVGTVALPLAGMLMSLPFIGWAKPVPVDPRNLRSPVWGNVFVSLAGPGSNLILCVICAALVFVHQLFFLDVVPVGSLFYPLVELLKAMIFVNAILAVFNMIPLPPLDGGALAYILLPRKAAESYEAFVGPYGFIILMFLAFAGGLRWVHAIAMEYVSWVDTGLRLVFGALLS